MRSCFCWRQYSSDLTMMSQHAAVVKTGSHSTMVDVMKCEYLSSLIRYRLRIDGRWGNRVSGTSAYPNRVWARGVWGGGGEGERIASDLEVTSNSFVIAITRRNRVAKTSACPN